MEYEDSLPCSKEPSTGPYMSQINPVRNTPSYLSKIHFNIKQHLSKYINLLNIAL
jgi:hypothetical protein